MYILCVAYVTWHYVTVIIPTLTYVILQLSLLLCLQSPVPGLRRCSIINYLLK
jgi:hypothetical protein